MRLVDDLLDVSRVMRGKIQLKKEPVEVRSAIHHAVEEARPALEGQEHEFALSLPDEPLWVKADPNRLSQIVSNLLRTRPSTQIRKERYGSSVMRDGDQLTIVVQERASALSRACCNAFLSRSPKSPTS